MKQIWTRIEFIVDGIPLVNCELKREDADAMWREMKKYFE